MNTDLSAEELEFQAEVRAFLEAEFPADIRHKVANGLEVGKDDSVRWQKILAKKGWAATNWPVEIGGTGWTPTQKYIFANECAEVGAPGVVPFGMKMVAPVIYTYGNEEQKEALLPPITSGESIVAAAIDEGPHHSPLFTALSARQEGDAYILNGRKAFVIDGMSADKLVVLARTTGDVGDRNGLSLFVLDTASDGLQRNRSNLVDSRDYADIELVDVAVPKSALLGDEALPALDTALDRARACLAAEMLGGAQHLFDRTVAYLKEREQFGAKIGSFQALQHRAARMYVELELTRSAVVDALSAIDEEREMTSSALPDSLPILALRNTVLFPGVVLPITVGRDSSLQLVKDANSGDKLVGVVAQKRAEVEIPDPDDLYRTGTAATILKLIKMPDGSVSIVRSQPPIM